MVLTAKPHLYKLGDLTSRFNLPFFSVRTHGVSGAGHRVLISHCVCLAWMLGK